MTQIIYLRDKNAVDLVLNSDGSIKTSKADISGLNVKITRDDISGANVKEFGSSILTAPTLTVESLSGGNELGSGATFKVVVRSQSGNTVMFIGGTGSNAPFNGQGLEMYGGESITIPVDNFNKVRVFASTSGQKVSFLGIS